jgi:hypothetical protein
MTITDLQRHADGYWVAHVADEFASFNVDRKAGSWQIVIPGDGGEYRRDVLPHVARALQARLPASERGGRRASVALTPDGARYGSMRIS